MDEDAGLESSPEHHYFLTLEKVFLELRGSPLALAPADWQVARRWHEMGIPADWAERELRDLFEKRRARGTVDKVRSLRYCRRSIEAAWKRRQELGTAAAVELETQAFDVVARLAALAEALPPELADRGELAARIRELTGGAEAVENALAELDSELLAAVEAGLGDGERAAIDADLERALQKLRRRLPEEELLGTEAQLRIELLRERRKLPVLSLFAPEAEEKKTPD